MSRTHSSNYGPTGQNHSNIAARSARMNGVAPAHNGITTILGTPSATSRLMISRIFGLSFYSQFGMIERIRLKAFTIIRPFSVI